MNTRTNIVLDDKLVAKAMKRAGVTTKKAAVEAALKAYVAKPDVASLLALRGSRLVPDDYDPKEPYGFRAGSAPAIASEPAPSTRTKSKSKP
jgi:hypothetical protein